MANVVLKRAGNLTGEVRAPSSKSYTQRTLIASLLSSGASRISGPLVSEDTEATLRAIKALGAKVNQEKDCWTVEGASPLKGSAKPIDCGESGATLRFMIPVAALADGSTSFLLGSSLGKRPVEPLLQSLRQPGVETTSDEVGGKSLIKVQ